MELAARTGAWSGKAKPYLRRVAYLESHGGQKIDTLICPSNHELTITYQTKTYVEDNGILHQNSSSSHFWTFFHLCEYRNALYWGTNGQQFSGGSWTPNKTTVVYNRGDNHEVLKDGFIIGSGYEITAYGTETMKLFSRHDRQFYGKIFGVVLVNKNSGLVELNFIPVLDLSGRPAMYDEVSGQLFYNQGTGEFTWGELET